MRRKEDDYRYAPDGTLLVRKREMVRLGGLDVMFAGRELWFPCSGEDPDEQFRRMVFLGWFGYHRFREGSWLVGICYLLTCGCFGVFYLYDLVAMLTDSYFFTKVPYGQREKGIERQAHRIYYRPVEDRRRALILLPVAVAILVAAIYFVYLPLGNTLFTWILTYISNGVTEEGIGRLLWMMQ